MLREGNRAVLFLCHRSILIPILQYCLICWMVHASSIEGRLKNAAVSFSDPGLTELVEDILGTLSWAFQVARHLTYCMTCLPTAHL